MTYHGRRAPNVSEYVANLNAIPQDQPLGDPSFHLDDDLAMFTNTQFFDFDLGQPADLTHDPLEGAGGRSDCSGVAGSIMGDDFDMPSLDFNNIQPGDFAFTDFNAFGPPQPVVYHRDGPPRPPIVGSTGPVYAGSASASPPNGLISPPPGELRRSDSLPNGHELVEGFDDMSRMAAEEDKRRRNTAASARFRVKKKQREQALERSAKEMNDKVAALEGRISQLETENKWLKNLITEKNESSKEDVNALWQKHNQESPDRKGFTRKDGVGTSN